MKRRALLKLLGLFSAVRGYNIAMVCVAQYLASVFVLSKQSWREVLSDTHLLMLVIAGALAIAGGYIINGFYDKLVEHLHFTAEQGFMKPEDLQRLIVCNTVADAIELLKPIVNMPDTMNVNKI